MELYKGAYPTRDIEQVRLIEGQAFSIGHTHDFASPLANGASIDIAVAFPQGINPIFSIKGLSDGDAVELGLIVITKAIYKSNQIIANI